MPFELTPEHPIVQRIALTLLILLAAFVLTRLGHRLAERYTDTPERRYRAARLLRRSVGVLTLLLALVIWSPGLGDVVTVLTVVGAGMAIAMREVLLSLAGWVRLAMHGPYKQGDRIEINGVRGDVVDVRLQHTTLMEVGGWVGADQSSGRLTHVPNSWILQYEIQNYTSGFSFVWNEFSVTVTFRSNWEAAREIMLELAEESTEEVTSKASRQLRSMAREYLVHYKVLTPFVYAKIAENGVQLTLRHLCEARQRRGTEHQLTLGLLKRFQGHGDIELAYPMTGAKVFHSPQFGDAPHFPGTPNDRSRSPSDSSKRPNP